ncbi:ParB/RepB/Spo0J family partition protein [Tessaracoccus caeni]|uniref:ParB/RepB/Spo0J family partition protein n=1 Tax=Tessaracoccus caeni TaxID=3031239 RepID=UPI0023DA3CDE|nr:ParB/RepB/Spo0J family partition protein [Tessaracoccus caeni]MDF1488102.1 ParB/RepB/Spo0J family partition protein [Tessaracoccus caeni]
MAAARQGGLGKGLGDLFARTDDVPEVPEIAGARFMEIPLSSIQPNPKQPRTNFDEDDLAELAESIREFGVLQPVVVREVGRGAYELVMGERRLRASERAGKEAIPAIIRTTDDDALLRDALLENLHRADLNPIEEANAYRQLLDDFACTQDELSKRIHRSRPQISNTLRLLNLPPKVQLRLAAGVISAGHARALLGLSDPKEQEELAQRIIAEGLSVRTTEELVALAQRGQKTRIVRGPRQPSDQERTLSRQLSDQFDTRVKVDIGRNKGRITIEFATGEDLDRIMAILDGTTVDV